MRSGNMDLHGTPSLYAMDTLPYIWFIPKRICTQYG